MTDAERALREATKAACTVGWNAGVAALAKLHREGKSWVLLDLPPDLDERAYRAALARQEEPKP